MTFGRRYRSARSAGEAAGKLTSGRATQFDPDLVDLFLSPPVFERAIAVLREDHGPKLRRVSRGEKQTEGSLPELSFRWRTTTPSPRAPDQQPQRSL